MDLETAYLMTDLEKYLARAVLLSAEAHRVIIAYIFLAHLAPLKTFPVVPYLHIKGHPGTGKSTLGRVLQSLTGGTLSSGTTPAAFFRELDTHYGRLCVLDEGGRVLKGSRKNDFEEIFLEGNWLGGVIKRSDRKKSILEYRIFGPKVLVSVEGIEIDRIALLRRVIPVTMNEAPMKFVSRKPRKQAKALRDRLEEWAEKHHKEIRARYAVQKKSRDFANPSHRELWAPIMAVADVLGLDLSKRSRRHGKILKRYMTAAKHDVPLDRALAGVLKRLILSGRYLFKDLRGRLQSTYGSLADGWNEERIGRTLRRMGYGPQIGKIAQGRYLSWVTDYDKRRARRRRLIGAARRILRGRIRRK